MIVRDEQLSNRLQKLQRPADLLVLWMQAIVEASDGQHDDALACDVLEASGDGNRASLTDQIRLHGKHYETQVTVTLMLNVLVLWILDAEVQNKRESTH